MIDRRISTLLLLVAALAFGRPALLGGLLAQDPEPERVLARIEVEAPAHSPFLLRATLPLPGGILPRRDGRIPFGVRSKGAGAPIVPAQVEVVTRGPKGEVEVVELLARVELARGTRAGQRVQFDVLPWLHEDAELPPRAPGLAGLLSRERGGRIVLRARDLFDNVYRFDLLAEEGEPGFGSRRRTKQGAFLVEERVAGTLAPFGRPRPSALPHLMGLHAWLAEAAGEEVLRLDLRVHNGAVSTAPAPGPYEHTLGIVYWKSLELVVPEGYVVLADVRDPLFGTAYVEGDRRVQPLVAPLPGGKLHMMPPQAHFHRRLAIAPAGSEERARRRLEHEGLGFCLPGPGLWSWFEPRSARYFPQRELLPRMDFYQRGGARGLDALRAHERERWHDVASQLESGEARGYPREGRVMGWAHPWFIPREGGHGGEDIDWLEGHRTAAAASRESYRRLELLHRMNACRQPTAMHDGRGEPLGVFDWRDETGRVRVDQRVYGRGVIPAFRLPCHGGPPASAQVMAVVAQDLRPPYDRGTPFAANGALSGENEDLHMWMPHDGSHLVRFTKNAKALVWLGNDSLAKEDLRMSAEAFRLYFHEFDGPGGSAERPMRLSQMEQHVALHPNEGMPVHREHGWGIDAVCAVYSFSDDAWRALHRPWLERVADLLVAGAAPSGLVIRNPLPELGNDAYHGALAFQCEIVLLAERVLVESALRGADAERARAQEALLLRAADYLYFGPPFIRQRASWSSDQNPVFIQGPVWSIPIGLADGYREPPFSDETRWGKDYLPKDVTVGGPEALYGFAVLSFAADATQRSAGKGLANRYLNRCLALGRPMSTFAESYAEITRQASESSLDPTSSCAGYLARLQALGVGRGTSSR